MKHIFCILLAFSMFMPTMGRKRQYEVTLYTTKGNIVMALYNDTPIHRDNFVAKVKAGAYDGVLFHRVINQFMVQGGDPLSKNARPGELLGEGNETVADHLPAEFRVPQHFHRRGALAAAREGDESNPERKSSSQQFYIVTGSTFDDAQLEAMLQRIAQMTGGEAVLTPEMREAYRTVGGAPHLDGSYTVFGEVLNGMEVVDSIQSVAIDAHDRPLEDIRILRAKVTKRRRSH